MKTNEDAMGLIKKTKKSKNGKCLFTIKEELFEGNWKS